MMQEPDKSIKRKIKSALQVGRAVRFVWQSAKGPTLANGALIAIQGLLPLLPLYLMKLMVDAVTAGLAAPDKGAAFRHVALLVALMAAATLLIFLMRSIAGLVGEWQAFNVADHMSMAWPKSAKMESRCWR
jgi:ATP-binding cassette subfamily B protein